MSMQLFFSGDSVSLPCLRILAMHEAKYSIYQKSETNYFQQWPIDWKSEVIVEKYPLVVEVKLNMLPDMILAFSISPLPLNVSFQMSALFLHLLTHCQKCSDFL